MVDYKTKIARIVKGIVMRDMSPRGKVIATLKVINGVDGGAVHVKNKDEKKSRKILKDADIEILHTGDFPEGEKTLFMDVKYIAKAAELLEAENITTSRSH